jgi:hypothetical protein
MDVTDREAAQLEESLRQQADRWRERLADPVLAEQVRAGTAVISPLVRGLLAAFPPAPKK